MKRLPDRGRRLAVAAGLVMLLAVGGGLILAQRAARATQQAQVRARGQQVMPFDLDQTLHTFQLTGAGGVETVVARDPANQEQIALIQSHLAHEAARFQQGDFADPAAIHGADMPGLAALAAGAQAMTFTYSALPAGGQITYETTSPDLRAALGDWFAAQVSDHGHDATSH